MRVAHDVVEDAETPVVMRQRLQRRADHDRIPGIQPRDQSGIGRARLEVDKLAALPFPEVADTPVDDDSMKPRRRGRIVTERVAVIQGLDEGVVNGVFGVLTTDVPGRDGAEPTMRALVSVRQRSPHHGS